MSGAVGRVFDVQEETLAKIQGDTVEAKDMAVTVDLHDMSRSLLVEDYRGKQ